MTRLVKMNLAKAVITLDKTQKQLEVNPGQNLMQALLDHDIPVASSCNGDGICGKCRIQILSGADHLSSATELEIFLRYKNTMDKNERISCQVQVLGDICIDTKYW